jgi:hypothetical protein
LVKQPLVDQLTMLARKLSTASKEYLEQDS